MKAKQSKFDFLQKTKKPSRFCLEGFEAVGVGFEPTRGS